MMRISDTVKHLIIINVLVFIGTLTIGGGQLFYEWFALYFPKNEAFKPWQIVTHMFMHGGFTHLLFNMFALWMFGSPVENVLGSKRFLFIYFSAGLGAVALQLGYYYFKYIPMEQEAMALGFSQDQIVEVFKEGKVFRAIGQEFNEIYYASMVGASGCIMGILAAFGMMNPNAELMMIFLPIPIKAKYFIPGIIILDLVSGITGQSFFSPSNTAYMAHVGGAITGFIIMWYWKKNQFNQNRWY
ncbi:rhomboid family intramembrane serine protease [Neotamlana laminarinivorans]|uniref:Rhomboid family intramembrane serine protease n=1 Tax=Neotamlana laminarinivorans TaxID=2883124 RepID=A0A9X1I337_9FLAO|nr:rhomboid family intramembrane serine protease [Tamlana laminarinivorans]MCB4799462.1 rhomboid family intramembrane serine protease [Tamlana laminarinivorans]